MFRFQEMSDVDNESILHAISSKESDLPGTRREIKSISKIMEGQYFFGDQAIEANFKKNAT